MKGQTSTLLAIIGGSATIIASLAGGWFLSSERVSTMDKQIGIVEEREQNHYVELKEKLESIDKKLDLLLEKK